MALTERSRSALYQGLSVVVADEQAVEEMLSYFPARDVEEPVTKEFLRAELAEFRAEFRAEMHALMRQQAQWMIGLFVSLAALQLTVIALVR